MKKTRLVSAGIAFGLGITFFLHAQETATLTQDEEVSLTATNVAEVASLSDFEAELMALEATPSMPASQLPEDARILFGAKSRLAATAGRRAGIKCLAAGQRPLRFG